MISALRRLSGSILARLFLVNLLVLLVPWAGLEFAQVHERQLLLSLERDMRNQAVLVREIAESALARGSDLGSPPMLRILVDAARSTRTRIRVLDAEGEVQIDSHAWGPPEGPEPAPPTLVPSEVYAVSAGVRGIADRRRRSEWTAPSERWPAVRDRQEVREALAGRPAAFTRVRDEHPSVILFLTEPVRHRGRVAGAIYVARSTQPVLEELYKIRRGLAIVMGITMFLTGALVLLLAFSISRPLGRLARAARRITAGEREVAVPVVGSGEIRELAQALSTMTRALDQRARYIADFSADVAHEFKSPLTSIRGAAELLEEGAADDPATRARFLRNIELDADRLDRLVSRLLELSRVDANDEATTAEIDVPAIAARVLERTDSSEQPVAIAPHDRIPAISGRPGDLERALLNLVENAQRFSPPGASVTIELEASSSETRIAVRDRGPGVPPEHRDKIFQRFFTTDAERHGTGLGLAIVKSVAEAHGGRAYLDTAIEGPGARFVIAIPRAP